MSRVLVLVFILINFAAAKEEEKNHVERFYSPYIHILGKSDINPKRIIYIDSHHKQQESDDKGQKCEIVTYASILSVDCASLINVVSYDDFRLLPAFYRLGK